jgi:hypothetical protein
MMTTEAGGPAFPAVYQGDTRSDCAGLSMRDYFATNALQALLHKDSNWREGWGRCTKTELAEEAYAFADAMLEARTK